MDFSERYIKMCEKAEEIQKEWKPKAWDWFAVKKGWDEEEDYYDWRRHASCYKVWIISGYETDCGFYGPSLDEMEEKEYKEHCIWLPRVDQLLEMFFGKSGGIWTIDVLAHWIKDPDLPKEYKSFSFEELLLAFVMRRKGKMWNNEKEEWVKEEVKESA